MSSSPSLSTTSTLRTQDVQGPKQPVPKWLPVALIALTSACLTVPALLLWRQRHRVRLDASAAKASPAPTRRNVSSRWRNIALVDSKVTTTSPSPSSSSSSIPPQRRTASPFTVSSDLAQSKASSLHASTSSQRVTTPTEPTSPQSFFDGPLAALGAFGLATVAVGVGATLSVWGVQQSMGVENTEQFATRMRQLLLQHLPVLSRRLYGSEKELSASNEMSTSISAVDANATSAWSADDSENRLREAFDRGGFAEWAEAATKELEAEARAERKRRGL